MKPMYRTAAEERLEKDRERAKKYYRLHREEIIAKKKIWAHNNKDKKRGYDIKRRENHRELFIARNREYAKRYRLRHPERWKQIAERYNSKNRVAVLARYQAKNKVLISVPCERCGGRATDRHHPDYSKPLEVMFLCHLCHCGLHKELREQQAAVRAVVRERKEEKR